MEKRLFLVYNVNDNIVTKRTISTLVSTGVTNPGQKFVCPQDVRRTIWNMTFTYNSTATVGGRAVSVNKYDQDDVLIQLFTTDPFAASLARRYTVGLYTGGNSTIDKPLFAPVHLEPNWYISIDDAANIDPLDLVTWKIEYQDVAI